MKIAKKKLALPVHIVYNLKIIIYHNLITELLDWQANKMQWMVTIMVIQIKLFKLLKN